MFCGKLFPAKKRKEASKTPTPPGAVGIIKPIAQAKQKITNKYRILDWLSKLTKLKQIINPINFDKTKRISIRNALVGKKETNVILSSN